jgi:hypothetical protein
LPYAWVPEWHKTHGLHLHFAVGQYVKKSRIVEAWGRGYVHIKLLSDLPVGSTTWHESRAAAGYLSKYVAKAFGHTLGGGLHRYDVAQSFQPVARLIEGKSSEDVLGRACEVMGGYPERRWSSRDSDSWPGPPAVWFAWA